MAERSRVNPILTTQHHILFGNDGMLRHGIFVQTRLLGWFSGGDVSVTIVSVLFCSESRFHSGHLHALIPAANCTTLFFLGEKTAGGRDRYVCEERAATGVLGLYVLRSVFT